jgi:hypothetical protein
MGVASLLHGFGRARISLLAPGLDAATRRADVRGAMDPRPAAPPVRNRPLLALLPAPVRRLAGMTALTLTLWLASFLALVR